MPLGAIFSSPIWTFVGVVVGALAIVVAVVLQVRSRSKKTIHYRITETSLVTVRDEARDQIEIRYAGEQVRQVHVIEIQLENSGTLAITAADFERQVKVSFGGSAVPLTAEISDTYPNDLSPQISVNMDNTIGLAPLLLNRHDSVCIKAFVRDFDGPVVVHARIANISHLTDATILEQRWQRRIRWMVPSALAGVLALMIVLLVVFGGIRLVTTREPLAFGFRRANGDWFCGAPVGLLDGHLVFRAHSSPPLVVIPFREIPEAVTSCKT